MGPTRRARPAASPSGDGRVPPPPQPPPYVQRAPEPDSRSRTSIAIGDQQRSKTPADVPNCTMDSYRRCYTPATSYRARRAGTSSVALPLPLVPTSTATSGSHGAHAQQGEGHLQVRAAVPPDTTLVVEDHADRGHGSGHKAGQEGPHPFADWRDPSGLARHRAGVARDRQQDPSHAEEVWCDAPPPSPTLRCGDRRLSSSLDWQRRGSGAPFGWGRWLLGGGSRRGGARKLETRPAAAAAARLASAAPPPSARPSDAPAIGSHRRASLLLARACGPQAWRRRSPRICTA